MRVSRIFLLSMCILLSSGISGQSVHVWEMNEITLTAENEYANPYTDVTVWIDLAGPGFEKRVYGFWDGGQTYRVRVVATETGAWTWASGSNQDGDDGLNQQTGGFTAIPWTEEEIRENPNRRGFIRATQNGHALEYADGSSFFMTGDTWLAASTWRLPFSGAGADDDYTPVPGITFEELITYLKGKKFNSISLIASFPNWINDGKSAELRDKNGVLIRASWSIYGLRGEDGKYRGKGMQDERGNHPFKMSEDIENVADYDRIIPNYFQSLDRKMEYMSDVGFVPFLEPVRRDHYPTWKTYHNFEESYSRYAQYIYSRYGAWNLIFSGIHLDVVNENASADHFNSTLTHHLDKYGPLPFGQPLTTLISITTYVQFGHGDDCPWLTMHTAGNAKARNHGVSPLMEEMFNLDSPYPVANIEPYFTGWSGNKLAGERPPVNSPRDTYFSRASMYCSVLSGGLAGHVHGHSAYDCTVAGEPEGHHPYIWEALKFESNSYMQYLRKFILSEGDLYQDLQPASNDLMPQKVDGSIANGFDGWSFMMRTENKNFALLYIENDAELPVLMNMIPSADYILQWYDPENGEWSEEISVETDRQGKLRLPAMPDPEKDWAAKLVEHGD